MAQVFYLPSCVIQPFDKTNNGFNLFIPRVHTTLHTRRRILDTNPYTQSYRAEITRPLNPHRLAPEMAGSNTG